MYKTKINKKFSKSKGFSLPEVIVAVSIIAMIIMTTTNLLVSSIRANQTNINQIIAYNLAEEALEGLRNVRDSYWINNQSWKGENNILGDSFAQDGDYIIERLHTFYPAENCATGGDLNLFPTVRPNAPWDLKVVQDPESAATNLFIEEAGGISRYTHTQSATPSVFKRWLEIKKMPYEIKQTGVISEDLKISVKAVVQWEEQGMVKTIEIPMILTDWKAGPL